MRVIQHIRAALASNGLQPGETETAAKARTRSLSIREGMLWSVMWAFGDFFVAPFAIFLKAGTTAMAILGTAPLLLGPLASIAGATVVERLHRRRPVILASVAIQGLCYIPIFLVPLLLPAHSVLGVVAMSILGLVAAGITGPAWTSMIGDVTEPATRGAYLGQRNRFVLLAMLVMLLAAGAMMSGFEGRGWHWIGFGISFAMAFLSRTASLRLLLRHYDPPLNVTRDDSFSFWDFIRVTPRSNFARFSWYVALLNGAVSVGGPFFNVYMLRDLHWSYIQFTSSTAVFLAAQVLLSPWWGQQIDRHGSRAVLRACSFLIPLLPLFWAFSNSFPVIMGAQVLSGCAWSGFNLAVSSFIYDAVSPAKRARVMSYHGVLTGICAFAGGSLLGAWLAGSLPSEIHAGPVSMSLASNLPAIFMISAILRWLVVLVMFPFFKEVRSVAQPTRSYHLLWRMVSGEPIIATLGPWIARTRRMM